MSDPIKNPAVETCAQNMALVWGDPGRVQALFDSLRQECPNLKKWEAVALASRVEFLVKQIKAKNEN